MKKWSVRQSESFCATGIKGANHATSQILSESSGGGHRVTKLELPRAYCFFLKCSHGVLLRTKSEL